MDGLASGQSDPALVPEAPIGLIKKDNTSTGSAKGANNTSRGAFTLTAVVGSTGPYLPLRAPANTSRLERTSRFTDENHSVCVCARARAVRARVCSRRFSVSRCDTGIERERVMASSPGTKHLP